MELVKKYSPSELSRLLGVSKSTLLYWEAQGLIPRAHRDNSLRHARYWTENEGKEIYLYRSTNH